MFFWRALFPQDSDFENAATWERTYLLEGVEIAVNPKGLTGRTYLNLDNKNIDMETLEFIKRPVDGKVVIDLPDNYNGKEVLVTIVEKVVEEDPANWSDLPGPKKLEILKKFWGAATYPHAETNKQDVYEQ